MNRPVDMSRDELKPGDLVDVQIKGVRMGERSSIRVTIEDEHGELWVLPPQAAIARVAPRAAPTDAHQLPAGTRRVRCLVEVLMTPTGELIAAVNALREDTSTPKRYVEVLAGWLLSCHDDLSKACGEAVMWETDPLTVVDEPDSCRFALEFARQVNATTEAAS